MGRNGSGSSGERGTSASWVGSLPLALPPERAWARFARVEDWRRWDWMGSADARWLAGEPWTVGARLRVGHRPWTFDCTVVTARPPREVVWEGRGLWFHGRHAFRFLPHPRGTLVQQSETFTGAGAPLLRPLIRWFWRHQLRAFARWAASAPAAGP
jgi:hypothetical protein